MLNPLRQAALCITSQPLLASGYRPSPEPHSITFVPRGRAVPLRSAAGPRGIALSIGLYYVIVAAADRAHGRWEASSVAYSYDVLDRDGRELLTYHWHPGLAGPDFPHLHISGRVREITVGPDVPPVVLGDMHLPTEQITFATIVRLLITEFGIEPRRTDWLDVLE